MSDARTTPFSLVQVLFNHLFSVQRVGVTVFFLFVFLVCDLPNEAQLSEYNKGIYLTEVSENETKNNRNRRVQLMIDR